MLTYFLPQVIISSVEKKEEKISNIGLIPSLIFKIIIIFWIFNVRICGQLEDNVYLA